MKQLTDEEVLQEIEELRNDEFVKLFRLQQRQKYKMRQKLYTLRYQQKQGKKLAEAGITEEMLKEIEDLEEWEQEEKEQF